MELVAVFSFEPLSGVKMRVEALLERLTRQVQVTSAPVNSSNKEPNLRSKQWHLYAKSAAKALALEITFLTHR
ncbi:MAG: hypothetical protein RL390_1044 [Actinomycetota bacterium]